MTRINCVPVTELTREHLIAEYRELPRISKKARPNPDAPSDYVLGRGHCIFFYDKGEWLRRRFEDEIVPEMRRRNYVTNFTKYRPHPPGLNNDWDPTERAVELSRQRIEERLSDSR